MRLTVVGPGRAGGSVALAAARVGHEIVGVLSRSPSPTPYGPVLDWDDPLPDCDLLLIAVRDDAEWARLAERSGIDDPRFATLAVWCNSPD